MGFLNQIESPLQKPIQNKQYIVLTILRVVIFILLFYLWNKRNLIVFTIIPLIRQPSFIPQTNVSDILFLSNQTGFDCIYNHPIDLDYSLFEILSRMLKYHMGRTYIGCKCIMGAQLKALLPGVSGESLVGPPWCRESPVSCTACVISSNLELHDDCRKIRLKNLPLKNQLKNIFFRKISCRKIFFKKIS